MIPLRDTIPSKNIPIINTVLIGINVVMFGVQLMQGPDTGFHRLVYVYGLVPARYTLPGGAAGVTLFQQALALVAFMFLHGGLLHLIGNMLSLYIFGDNVEDRLGPLRYTIFYLLSGLISGLTHLVFNAHSTHPTIGASGAVAGVMGAYFLLYPRARILTLIPIIFIPWIVEIPAFFFIGFWFLIQIFNVTSGSGTAGNIAWWAHIGGFICGMILLKLFLALPSTGISSPLRKATVRKKSYRFQVARPTTADSNMDMHATLTISPYEALVGTRKLVTVPYGLQRRMFRVNVPPGMESGKLLRLKGQGRSRPDGNRGDLLLKVIIQ
jgi:membrane associated rhomboid family serine protease